MRTMHKKLDSNLWEKKYISCSRKYWKFEKRRVNKKMRKLNKEKGECE